MAGQGAGRRKTLEFSLLSKYTKVVKLSQKARVVRPSTKRDGVMAREKIRQDQRLALDDSAKTLSDKRSSGREITWRDQKRASLQLGAYMRVLGLSQSTRVLSCGDRLFFSRMDDGSLKLRRSYFCDHRLCPTCNRIRSSHLQGETIPVIKEARRREPLSRFIFLTLTDENAYSGEELDRELDNLSRAFTRLLKYKKIKQNLLGYIRSTEITINRKDRSYHHHIHAVLMVRPSYFEGSENYITQEEYRDLWQRALRVEYRPIVHVKAVRDLEGEDDDQALIRAVIETVKYTIKSGDYLTGSFSDNLQAIQDLTLATFKKREISFGGLLREIRRSLKTPKTTDQDETTGHPGPCDLLAVWSDKRRDYIITEPPVIKSDPEPVEGQEMESA